MGGSVPDYLCLVYIVSSNICDNVHYNPSILIKLKVSINEVKACHEHGGLLLVVEYYLKDDVTPTTDFQSLVNYSGVTAHYSR